MHSATELSGRLAIFDFRSDTREEVLDLPANDRFWPNADLLNDYEFKKHRNASSSEKLVFLEFVIVEKGQRSTVPMP